MQLFNIMLKPAGAAGYIAAARLTLDETPARGAEIVVELAGQIIRGTVEEIFIPPGCDEHCIATIFASAA
jgi:hypothetical protein